MISTGRILGITPEVAQLCRFEAGKLRAASKDPFKPSFCTCEGVEQTSVREIRALCPSDSRCRDSSQASYGLETWKRNRGRGAPLPILQRRAEGSRGSDGPCRATPQPGTLRSEPCRRWRNGRPARLLPSETLVPFPEKRSGPTGITNYALRRTAASTPYRPIGPETLQFT